LIEICREGKLGNWESSQVQSHSGFYPEMYAPSGGMGPAAKRQRRRREFVLFSGTLVRLGPYGSRIIYETNYGSMDRGRG